MATEGIFASIKTLALTLLGIVQTRLELVRVEIEEGRQRMIALIGLALTAIFCLCLGLVFLAILLVVLFWDTHRILVISLLTGGFLAASGILWALTLHRLKTMPKMFEASLAELLRDRQQLEGNDE